MANIQGIRRLEERIYDAVNEYVENPECYTDAVLHVYLDEDDMEHYAVVDNASQFGAEDETYPIADLVRIGDNGEMEVDIDKASDIANTWIF
jgi:hypothetical protein